MRNIYYEIWVDSIVGFRKHNPRRKDWKITIFVINTTVNALNLFAIDVVLKLFGVKTFRVEMDILQLQMLNSFASFVIQYASIFILLNYFLIFRKDKYLMLIEVYPHRNGKFAMLYGLFSVLISFVLTVLYGILS